MCLAYITGKGNSVKDIGLPSFYKWFRRKHDGTGDLIYANSVCTSVENYVLDIVYVANDNRLQDIENRGYIYTDSSDENGNWVKYPVGFHAYFRLEDALNSREVGLMIQKGHVLCEVALAGKYSIGTEIGYLGHLAGVIVAEKMRIVREISMKFVNPVIGYQQNFLEQYIKLSEVTARMDGDWKEHQESLEENDL